MNIRKIMNELNELLQVVESCYMLIAKNNDLTYNELMLLIMVYSNNNLTQKQVCDTLFLPKSSVHCILFKLIEKGYLVLSKGNNNKEKYIIPTEFGEKFIKKIINETEIMENNALKSISSEDTIIFIDIARKLSNQMKKEVDKLYE